MGQVSNRIGKQFGRVSGYPTEQFAGGGNIQICLDAKLRHYLTLISDSRGIGDVMVAKFVCQTLTTSRCTHPMLGELLSSDVRVAFIHGALVMLVPLHQVILD
jgi:hypothetical protein